MIFGYTSFLSLFFYFFYLIYWLSQFDSCSRFADDGSLSHLRLRICNLSCGGLDLGHFWWPEKSLYPPKLAQAKSIDRVHTAALF